MECEVSDSGQYNQRQHLNHDVVHQAQSTKFFVYSAITDTILPIIYIYIKFFYFKKVKTVYLYIIYNIAEIQFSNL